MIWHQTLPLKRDSNKSVYCETCESVKNLFTESLRWLLQHQQSLKLMEKKKSSQAQSFPNKLLTMQLDDYIITKHSIFIFEMKQRTPHALLILKQYCLCPFGVAY